MSIGFRKSLFGFNSSDVIEYIEKAHKRFSIKEEALNSELNELKATLEKTNADMKVLTSERDELNEKLAEFTAKYDEIERLSENIGKLYLVAQTNAKIIMENSEENAEISRKEVSGNLFTIDEAHKSLQELRQNIIKTSEDFTNEVDRLMNSLNNTREKIAKNDDKISDAAEEFKSVFAQITE